MGSETYELVAPIVFLCVVLLLVIILAVIYKGIVNQSCACLSDPGGREKARHDKNKKNGYDKVSGDTTESDDDDNFVPPTMVVSSSEPALEEGELVVSSETLSAYSAFSAYGDTMSQGQSYMSDQGLGRLKFDVNYVRDQSRLIVHIVEGDNLPSKEQGGARDFRIHLTLLPKREQRLRSKTRSRYSPKFDETFEFKNVLKDDLFSTAVRLRLYGAVGTGKLVGETFFQLADIAKMNNPVIQGNWRAFRTIKTTQKK